mgnify:CR=1 FL=1
MKHSASIHWLLISAVLHAGFFILSAIWSFLLVCERPERTTVSTVWMPGTISFAVSRTTDMPDKKLTRDLYIQPDLDNQLILREEVHIDQEIKTPA